MLIAALLLLAAWIVAGLFYSDAGAYDRHGIFSLLICLPYWALCVVGALLGNLARFIVGGPPRS